MELESPTSGSPIKVLHLIPGLDVGGAESLLCNLLPNLNPQRIRGAVAFFRGDGRLSHRLENASIPVFQLRSGLPWNSRLVGELKETLAVHEFEILHSHLPRAHWLAAFAERSIHRSGGSPPARIQTRHNINHYSGWRRLVQPVDRWAARRTDRILAVSQAVLLETQKRTRLPKNRFQWMPNGVDPSPFLELPDRDVARSRLSTELRIPNDGELLLCVGSLTRQKGQDVLLEALSHLREDRPKLWVLLAGVGVERGSLQKLASTLGVAERVSFLGTREDVPSLLASVDLYVQPSRWEGFGLAAVEAMISRVPVVASAVGGLAEILETGNTGRLVPPENAIALADAIRDGLNRPEESRKMATRAHRVAIEEYGIRKMALRLERLYEEIAKRVRFDNGVSTRKARELL